MQRLLLSLFFVAALLFSQHAAMLHGLAHAEHDVALAGQHDGQAPALDHGADVCAAFGALAHAIGSIAAAPPAICSPVRAQSTAFSTALALTRIGFDSRAPPLSA